MTRKVKSPKASPPRLRPRFTQKGLTAWQVPGTYCDEQKGGLYLQVTQVRENGTPVWETDAGGTRVPKVRKYWTFRYWRDVRGGGRKLCEYGIGSFADYNLNQAREKAGELRRLRHDSIDPIEARKKRKQALKDQLESTRTFSEAAQECWQSLRGTWKQRHASDWINSLKNHVYPALGQREIRSITPAQVESVLRPIWEEKAETASRVQERMKAVFNFAKGRGWLSGENPAAWEGNLDALLGESSRLKKQKNHPSLPFSQIDTFMAVLRRERGIAARALEFCILTAARSGEARLAVWGEFNLEKALWTVPAERMKAKKEHLVPLSSQALALLRSLGPAEPSAYVFPSSKPGTCQSDAAMTALIKRMDSNRLASDGVGWRDPKNKRVVPHGFRATFRTWAGEKTPYAREVIEYALAHQLPDKTEAAYARATMLEKRTPLMQDWAVFCTVGEGRNPAEALPPRFRRVKNYDGPEPVILKIEVPPGS